MKYSIVIPVYNSNATLAILLQEIYDTMSPLNEPYEVVLVDDCSNDQSWNEMKRLRKEYSMLKILRLANNVGQWMATLAGISETIGKYIITIDDDLEYDTKDIVTLIKAYESGDKYIIYGIPNGKSNKNISYKMFFSIRNKFLEIFFDKIQTESFKIFKREIYLDASNTMRSFMHFEAYTKFVVARKYIGYEQVSYRSRYAGNSNHTLWMKIRLLTKYGIEYYRSPFKYPLYALFICAQVLLLVILTNVDFWNIVVVAYIAANFLLLIIGILGKYLSSIYLKIKGMPEFVIIEKL